MTHRTIAAAVRDLRARAAALREDHPGRTDPLADALWEQCQHTVDHAMVYDDPRAIAAVALEHLAAELARDVTCHLADDPGTGKTEEEEA